MDDKNYERVCLYLLRMADYMSDPDDLMVRTPPFEREGSGGGGEGMSRGMERLALLLAPLAPLASRTGR